MQNKSGTYII